MLTTTQQIVNIGDKTFCFAKRVSFSDTPTKEKEKRKTTEATVGNRAVSTLIDQNKEKWRQ